MLKNKYVAFAVVVMSLLPLVISKVSPFINHGWFAFLGVSYITFRCVQVIVESYDGLIYKMTVTETLSFLLFFPSLSSGPIDRSRRFLKDYHNVLSKEDYCEYLGTGIYKLLIGVLYKFVLSAFTYNILMEYAHIYTPKKLIIYAYLYGIYMFFDFAGYSLMAIGTGYILGIKVPENFNAPFISKDIKDFWNRWHISLSHWFRDFVFSRFTVSSIKKKRFKSRVSMAFVGYMINMTLMGLWHGLTIDYILYGIYHGLLLGLNEYYQKKCPLYKKYKKNKVYIFIQWFITLNLVMFGFLIFSGKFMEVIRLILERI